MRAPALLTLLALALALVASAAHAATPFKPPRLSDGHPDLQGDWTNSSITSLERAITYGDRRVLTPGEVADEEAEFNWLSAPRGPTDPALATPVRPPERFKHGRKRCRRAVQIADVHLGSFWRWRRRPSGRIGRRRHVIACARGILP